MPIQSEQLEARTLLAASFMPLVTFTGANGDTPLTVLQDNSGDLVGIKSSGGANGFGEIFRLPFANNPQLEILFSFTNGPEGSSPIILAMNANGDKFSTTTLGRANNVGTVFKLARGSSTIETLLALDDTPSDIVTVGAKLAPFTDPAENLTLTNNGNIDAAGKVAATASLTTDPAGAGGQSVPVKPLKVKLKPAASRTFRISLTVPADLSPGSYFLSLVLDVAVIGDTVPANGVAVTLMPLTVS